jgi:hypothetical protein
MLVENEYGGEGTGFLVFRPNKTESNEGKVFLITNKHVLNPDPEKREQAKKITLHLNRRMKITILLNNRRRYQLTSEIISPLGSIRLKT